jgi:protein O-mannosyl-transferase
MTGNKESTAWVSKGWRVMFLCFLLVAVTMALYAPSARYGYIDYDDGDYVFDNPHVSTGLSLSNLAWAVRAVCVGNWHPLTLLSYMADCQLFGVNPGPQHLVNAILHSANTALLFLFLLAMTGMPWRSSLVAALFGCHPLHVESVVWIAERKDVLSGFFFMLTLWSYANFARARVRDSAAKPESECQTQSPAGNRRPVLWYGAAWIFLAFGLMSKPMLVTTPFLLLLLDYWPWNRASKLTDFWSLLWEKGPLLGLSAASCALTLWAQGSSGAVVSLAGMPLLQRLANAAASYVFYIGKLFWPQGLLIPYVPEAAPDPMMPWFSASGLVVATVVFVWLGIRWKYLAAGWLWYLGALVPVIGIVQAGIQCAADRYTYLPAIGIFILAVWAAADLLAACRVPRFVTGFLAVGIVGACGLLAAKQLRYWRNSESLFVHSLTLDPTNLPALDCLAGSYATDPDPRVRNGVKGLRLAQACVDQTQRREPVYLMTLAAAYAELGQFRRAIETAQEALRLTKPGTTTAFVTDLKADIELYQTGKAIHERYLVADQPSPPPHH